MEAGPEAPWPRCAFDTREPNGANAAHGDFVDVVPSPSRHSATGPHVAHGSAGPLGHVGSPTSDPERLEPPRCPETGAGPNDHDRPWWQLHRSNWSTRMHPPQPRTNDGSRGVSGVCWSFGGREWPAELGPRSKETEAFWLVLFIWS